MSGTLPTQGTNNGGNTSTTFAWISCDESDYPGNLGPVDALQSAVDSRVAAAIMYSRVDDYCNFTAGSRIPASYNRLYSTSSPRDGNTLQNMMDFPLESSELHGRINLQYKLQQQNNNSDGSQGNGQPQNPGGPSPSTAVAMIILYSITGVITALFLIIIITGAIRAHRHPERYGPRAMLGRARQSRARGLARAMLDSIPIVKFGDDENAAPKPGDVELTAAGPANEGSKDTADTAQAQKQRASAEIKEEEDAIAGASRARPSHESEDGIRANTAETAPVASQPDQAQGCSICTEDFERGEDVRLLPCSHKFHPPCIDPWLLNVSSTCPLCRVDLRPPTSHDQDRSDQTSESGSLTGRPPDIVTRLGVSASDEDGTNSRRTSHRLSFLFDPLNRRRMQDATPAERIEALRQYNQSQRTNEDSRRKRMSNRLSALINRSRGVGESSEDASRSVTPAIGHAEPQIESPAHAIMHEPPPELSAQGGEDQHATIVEPPLELSVEDAEREDNTTPGPSAEPPATSSGAEISTPAASLYEEAPEHGESQMNATNK